METMEIEPARVQGARVERACLDPRSQVGLDDARTHFSAGRRGYDVIISATG